MIGGLLFSYYTSSYFDSHVKEFRLFADIVNDIGLTLDMITPYIPKSYLLCVSVMATLCRTLCGISAGATKGSITQHFAIHSNMADLNAKEGTQETLVSLIGMILGIMLAKMIQTMDEQCQILQGGGSSTIPVHKNALDNHSGSTIGSAISSFFYTHGAFIATWYIFISLTWVHVWANYVGVNKLRLKTLNRQRAEVVLDNLIQKATTFMNKEIKNSKPDEVEILKEKAFEFIKNDIRKGCGTNSIIPPNECKENLFDSFWKIVRPGKLSLGTELKYALTSLSDEDIIYLVGTLFQSERYLLSMTFIRSSMKINVILHKEAREKDKLMAFVHGLIMEKCIKIMDDSDLECNVFRMRLVTW